MIADRAIAIAYNAWGGIQFYSSTAFNPLLYTSLDYYLNPQGLPIADFSALLQTSSGQVLNQITLGPSYDLGTLPNGFHHISLPISQLDPSGVLIDSVQLKNATGSSLPSINVDDVQFR